MKKTLIALAVTASAVMSGSAMAWTQGAVNGGVDFSGSLTPEMQSIPWEVQIGAAVNDLAGTIKQGSTSADVPVNNTIPVLGIRSVSSSGFVGAEGLNPQISYGDAVDFSASQNGVAPVTLKVKNADNQSEIGTLKASMKVIARLAWQNIGGSRAETFNAYATAAGNAFYGGVGSTKQSISASATVSEAADLFSGVTDTFNYFNGKDIGSWGSAIVNDANQYHSGFYASGITAGSVMKLSLNTPADANVIHWAANLPVTVSYQ
ncbi:fimbrial protein [Escherichia coli]|nr:fimbrial protein [Escherichia coli]